MVLHGRDDAGNTNHDSNRERPENVNEPTGGGRVWPKNYRDCQNEELLARMNFSDVTCEVKFHYHEHNGWPNGCSFSLKGPTVWPFIVLRI